MIWAHAEQVRLREITLGENSVWVDAAARRISLLINERRFNAITAERLRRQLWAAAAGWEHEGDLGQEIKAMVDHLSETVQ